MRAGSYNDPPGGRCPRTEGGSEAREMTMERSCIGFAGSGGFSRAVRAGTERSLRRFCIVRAVLFVFSYRTYLSER